MSSVRPGGTRPPHGAGRPGDAAGQRPGAAPAPGPGRHLPRGPAQLLVPITNGASAPDAVRAVIEELIPLADVGSGGDTL